MEKQIIIIGTKQVGISTIYDCMRREKIKECINCFHKPNLTICCISCSKLFNDDLEINDTQTRLM